MKLILFIHAYDIILYINSDFCFCQVRTMFAMATFFIVVIILAKSQVSVYRTIDPLVIIWNFSVLLVSF